VVDSTAVTGADDNEPPAETAPPLVPRLCRVDGPRPNAEPPPVVRLRREFKGLTVADLQRDEIVERLPGQVRSALRHLQRGDEAAAERALPGEFAPVLAGPGHRPPGRRVLAAAVVVLAMLAAVAAANWFFA
jgi:hypothetical protein